MSHPVVVQLFHMVPLATEGRPQPDTDPASCYGFVVYDEQTEYVDFGLSLEDAQRFCRPRGLIDRLGRRHQELAFSVEECGATINERYYSPEELCGEDSPPSDADDGNDCATLVRDVSEALDPHHQGVQWPDPYRWDGRPAVEQLSDLLVLVDAVVDTAQPENKTYWKEWQKRIRAVLAAHTKVSA